MYILKGPSTSCSSQAREEGLQQSIEVISSEEEAEIERVCMPASVHDGENIFDSRATRNDYAARTFVDSYVTQAYVARYVQQAAAGPDTLDALFHWPEQFLVTTKVFL